MHVLIDVGNTRVKLAVSEGGRITRLACLSVSDLSRTPEAFLSEIPRGVEVAAVSSVVPRALEAVTALLVRAGLSIRVAGGDLPIPIETDVEQREGVGTDRLLESLGAWGECRRSLIVVGFGSAVTFNCVDSAGVFLGGLILPGPRLSARALSEGTAVLPEVTVEPAPAAIPRNTENAIAVGIARALIGGVSAILRELRDVMQTDPVVFATGGGADAFATHIAGIDRIDDLLLFKGLDACLES